MTPILYENTETAFLSLGLGALNDCLSCYVTTVLNGVFELVMTYPVTGKRFNDLKLSRIIKATAEKNGTPQLFDIYAISKPMNGIVTVYASHVTGRKQFIPVMPCQASSVQSALIAIDGACAIENPFTLWSDKTTAGAFDLTVPASLGSVLGGMRGSLLDVYGGEYEFDNWTIKLLSHRGQDNGVSLRYGKNITDITQEESIESTITGIVPYWSDSEGNTVVLPESYVESENADNFPFKRTVIKDFSTDFDEQPTVEQLRAKAESYISQSGIGVPQVSITLSYENLADYEEYAHVALLEQVRLGDTVHVYFDPLGITADARIVSTEYDVLADKYRKTKIGSVKANMSTVLKDISQETEQEIDDTRSDLQKAFDKALDELSGAEGGNIVIRKNPVTGKPYEILIMDTDNVNTAQQVLRLNMNGLGLSTNGINGPYTIAATGSGLVATSITTGTLNANLIAAGVLRSQDSANDPSFYLDLISGVLRGKFSELSIEGQSVEDIAGDVLGDWVSSDYADDLAALQAQIDGQIETYFDNYVPTTSNAPANTWTTTALKEEHLGDLFYVIDNQQHGGECYRWVKDGNTYKWQLIEDSAVATALQEALAAQALAGQKARVFVTTPTPPYDVGDLWLNTNTGDIMRCQTAKTAAQSYSSSDWVKASGYVTDSSLTQYDILRRLTNEFEDEGIYLNNGNLYINATYIKSGTLSGIRVEAQEGLIGGWTIDSQRIYKERTVDGITYRAALYAPTTPNLTNAAFYIRTIDQNEDESYPIRLQYDGTLIATNADIKGTVTAESGKIGGWTVNDVRLYNEKTISGTTYRAGLYAPESTLTTENRAFYIMTTTNGTSDFPFAVTYGGKLTAKNAEIEGSVIASSGEIAGWTIGQSTITKTSVIDGVTYKPGLQAASGNVDAAAFYVRVDEPGQPTDYPFIVRYSGALTAKNATITGRILAESGVIGNNATNKINIGTNATNASIYNGMTSLDDTTHNGFYIGADGIALGKGKFKITSAGVLTAREANISGTINSEFGNIGGWNISSTRISKDFFVYDAQTDIQTTYRASMQGAPTTFSPNSMAFYIKRSETGQSDEYPFVVRYSGAMEATEATIQGVIRAESGYIGYNATNRITIGTNGTNAAIYNGMTSLSDTSHNGFYVGADGIALGKGKFKVTSAGALNASDANITGTITSANATITGGSINIQTSNQTDDIIQLNYSGGNAKIMPYGIYAYTSGSKTEARYTADGVAVYNTASNNSQIAVIGRRPGYTNNGQLLLLNNGSNRALLSAGTYGGLLYLYNTSGTDVVNLEMDSAGASMYIYDKDRDSYAVISGADGIKYYDGTTLKDYTAIGDRVTSNKTTGTNVPASTSTTVNTLTVSTAHTYIVTAQIRFPNNSNGRRELSVCTLSGSSYVYVPGSMITQSAVDGEETRMVCTFIVKPSANTLYLRAMQTSGSTLSVTSYFDAVCII